MRSEHVSRVIAASPEVVYAFAAQPDNLALWAGGLAKSEVRRRGECLVVDSPMGEVTVAFTPQNEFGVLDHQVQLPSGEVVNNPLRVLPHPDGAEVVFTVRQLGLTDAEFERDAATVAEDLETLKPLIEGGLVIRGEAR